ncbi:hypothetical protein MRX96_020427 [Rhipicephalus microplus]
MVHMGIGSGAGMVIIVGSDAGGTGGLPVSIAAICLEAARLSSRNSGEEARKEEKKEEKAALNPLPTREAVFLFGRLWAPGSVRGRTSPDWCTGGTRVRCLG